MIAPVRRKESGQTCIEFLALLGILAGGVLGFHLGLKFGWFWAILGAVIGAVIGLPVGAFSFLLFLLIAEIVIRIENLSVKIFKKPKNQD